MKRKLLLASTAFLISLNVFSPSSAQTVNKCEQYQEAFTFQIPNYAVTHQGGAILNIKVAYRFTPDAITQKGYPDFVPVAKDIQQFFSNYPNDSDYWEIMNNKLAKFLLAKYPQMSSVSLEIGVSPTQKVPFHRSSVISSTRPQACAVNLESVK